MNIKCPLCKAPVELKRSTTDGEIRCFFCGYTFNADAVSADSPPSQETAASPRITSGAPRPREWLVSPAPRGWAAIFAGAAFILASVVKAGLMRRAIEIAEPMGYAGRAAPDATVAEWRNQAITATLAEIAAAVLFAVFFLMWQYRVYRNLQQLEAREMRFSAGSSVGWWFCPIVNLWKPCQAMIDIWRGSDPKAISSSEPGSIELVGFWWILLVVAAIYSRVAAFMLKTARTDDDYLAALWMDIGKSASGSLVAVLTIVLIWVVSSRQLKRHAALRKAK